MQAKNPKIHVERSFYRSLLALTLPVALQNVISYSVNLMDTLMLGGLGEVALSATSLANQVFFIYTVAIFGVAGGAIVLCSQYWGKKDVDSICRVASLALRISAAAGLLFTLVLFLFPRPVMQIFTAEPAVIEAGASYLRIVSLSYFFYGVTSTFLVVLRSVETVNVSVAIYGVSFAVNVFFNYVFIFGKFGAPRMGVAGAARRHCAGARGGVRDDHRLYARVGKEDPLPPAYAAVAVGRPRPGPGALRFAVMLNELL